MSGAGEGSSSAAETVPGSPVYVRLLLQVLLPEEDIAAAASRCSPTPVRYTQIKTNTSHHISSSRNFHSGFLCMPKNRRPCKLCFQLKFCLHSATVVVAVVFFSKRCIMGGAKGCSWLVAQSSCIYLQRHVCDLFELKVPTPKG